MSRIEVWFPEGDSVVDECPNPRIQVEMVISKQRVQAVARR